MNTKEIYILGAGGMAREAYQIYKDNKTNILIKSFIVNLEKNQIREIYSIPVKSENDLANNGLLIAAIGSPIRKTWVNQLENKNFKFDTIIHRSANIGTGTKIGTGSIICANAVLTCDLQIGNHSIINVNSSIHHDCEIGNFVTIGPGSNIVGRVHINDESFIGAGVTVIPGITIGKSVLIGAGSVVVSDIPDYVVAYGVPAKIIRKITDKDWNTLI